ncbi:MAG: double zinc ribbon domain-containing protein [Lachnospiraceae bacterium]|nr:double zinc ribbon domain-containing protein [Lachnospiraceae bacterium]
MKVNVLSVNNFMSNVINVVYPTRCPGCDGLIKKEELSHGFCKKCKPDLEMVSVSSIFENVPKI